MKNFNIIIGLICIGSISMMVGCDKTTTTNVNATKNINTAVPAVNENINNTVTTNANSNRSTNTNTNLNTNNVIANTNTTSATNTNTVIAGTEDWSTFSNSELGYSIEYPKDWRVDDQTNPNKQVFIAPVDAEPFTAYISLAWDNRTLDVIRDVSDQDYNETQVIIAGKTAYKFTHKTNENSVVVYIPYKNGFYSIDTGKYNLTEVQHAIESFEFITE